MYIPSKAEHKLLYNSIFLLKMDGCIAIKMNTYIPSKTYTKCIIFIIKT